MTAPNTRTAQQADAALTCAFLPLHKRAFGMATGAALALVVFVATAVVVTQGDHSIPLELLNQFFAGYEVSWMGAVIGAAWAGFAGFVMGWFLAFCRNVLVGLLLIYVRTKAEFAQTRDLLDHI